MDESILNDIKKLIGITEEYDAFDTDLIMHINSSLAVLNQIGVGKTGFVITGPDETWEEFIDSGFEYVKQYVYLKVKMIFDPPLNSGASEIYENRSKELEWRLYVGHGQY